MPNPRKKGLWENFSRRCFVMGAELAKLSPIRLPAPSQWTFPLGYAMIAFLQLTFRADIAKRS
jgi:hypothetical protein